MLLPVSSPVSASINGTKKLSLIGKREVLTTHERCESLGSMGEEAGIRAPDTTGITLQIYVPTEEARTAREYYSHLFGREPEFEPHDDFFEWAPIAAQECWFQVAGREDVEMLTNRIRFRVVDLSGAVKFLEVTGIPHSEPSHLQGVVAFVDFSDPWGNKLGYYEDLVPSGQQQEYRGTSVNDVSQFSDFPVQ